MAIDREIIDELGLKFYKDRTNESFTEFYEYFHPVINNYIWKNFPVLSSRINEVKSGFFFATFTNIEQFKPDYSFSAWCSGILRNECLANFNRKARKGKETLNRGHYPIDENTFNDTIMISNIEQWIEDEDTNFKLNILYRELNNLPPLYKDIMIDKYVNGLKNPELVVKYNLIEKTIKTRIFNGTSLLKKKINPTDDSLLFGKFGGLTRIVSKKKRRIYKKRTRK